MGYPIRTCLGCGLKTNKGELVRLVVSAGALAVDVKGILPGRGAYCCRKASCYQRLVKQRKKLVWGLRCQEMEKVSPFVVSPGLEALFG
jgi:predicted RNA-binding protein YlxR (DUF448 family)